MKTLGIAGLLGLLFVVIVTEMIVQAQEDFSLNASFGVRAIKLLAESYITGLIESMLVMTATADLRTGDWEQMKGLLAQFEESKLSYNVWFLKPDGSYYKVGTGLASANSSDRDYYTRVMAGETTLGDLLVSRSTGRKSMVLTSPIYNGPSVIGALGVTLVWTTSVPSSTTNYSYLKASGSMPTEMRSPSSAFTQTPRFFSNRSLLPVSCSLPVALTSLPSSVGHFFWKPSNSLIHGL